MTSTNFNVGMNETRNSSRVLKPPGGGHSDIFGIYNEHNQEQQTPSTRHKQPRTTIGEIFSTESETGAPTSINHHHISNEQKTDLEVEEQPETSTHIAIITNENDTPKPSVPVPVQQRIRIPPGGFSTGLW